MRSRTCCLAGSIALGSCSGWVDSVLMLPGLPDLTSADGCPRSMVP
jgi:hypothetical protein